jgi:2-oxoglutarate ferredoxin oxidoreductase subunit beta
MATFADFKGQQPAWCPGCGNFGILAAFKKALVELEIEPYEYVIVSGIGQSGKVPHYIKCNAFNGLHGRTLPVATGVRLANQGLLVCAFAGDGDCYGEGGNHFIHAIRRNINVKLFVHDNQVYGLTKGQASPTSLVGMQTAVQPFGVMVDALNPVALAVALGCSFVARGYAKDAEQLTDIMKRAITHDGFSLVDIFQPCVTFNHLNTYDWYDERIYYEEPGYDLSDRVAAFEHALEFGDHIPGGVLFREERDTYEEKIPVLASGPLVQQNLRPVRDRLEKTLAEFY